MSDRFYWNGKQMVPSGTTVLPSPYLAQWAANCAVDYLVLSKSQSEQTMYGLGEELQDKARTAFLRESTEAADYGTYIHRLCEICLNCNSGMASPHEMTQKFMNGFWDWKEKHNVKPIAMEHEILMPWYGGRLDLVCEMDSFWMTKAWCKKFGVEWYKGIEKQRVIVLVDFKTGKGVYYENWKYQLAGYRQGWNEQVVDEFDGLEYKVRNQEMIDKYKAKLVKHHGILKFNKETGKVNYKDFTVWETTRTIAECPRLADGTLRTEKYIRGYTEDVATFNNMVAGWWLTKRGTIIERKNNAGNRNNTERTTGD